MVGEGGTVIALAVRRSRRRVVGYFLAVHALSRADAAEYKPERPMDKRQFDAMRERGILHEASPGHYWIDLPALRADEDRRRRKLVPVVIAVAVALALVLTLFYRG